MKKNILLPHLKIRSQIVPKFVLLPGDPARVDIIGKQLEKFKILNQNREFRTGIGKYKGISVLVCSTGIGCPSTAIATEELIRARAKILIRIGTCGGSWKNEIKNGSIIIPNSSVRDEGTTSEYIPQGFPAVADNEVIQALKNSSEENRKKYYIGINRTHDAFFGSQESITKWGKYLLDKKWNNNDTPILSSDMECSAIFVIASLMGVKAGAILLANANPEPLLDRIKSKKQKVITENGRSKKEIELDMNNMIKITLNAVQKLEKI